MSHVSRSLPAGRSAGATMQQRTRAVGANRPLAAGTAGSMAELPIVFRPSAVVRAVAIAILMISGTGAAWQLALGAAHGARGSVAAAAVIALPALIAAVILRRRIVVEQDGLVSTSLLRTRRVAWSSVRWLDQTRSSFTVYGNAAAISAGLIAPASRDRLMRLILQHARLVVAAGDLRWGIVARYIPRAQPISLVERPQP